MKITKLFSPALLFAVALSICSCNKKQSNVSGAITDACDSLLYLEHMSLNGAVAIDSAKLDADGHFQFSTDAQDAPEFYRLRIAGQIINLGVDSTETIEVSAAYPTMSSAYDIKGSEECLKIKELALMQLNLQLAINGIASNPAVNGQQELDTLQQVLAAYKEQVKRQYIFKEPMKAYSYYALFQTFSLGGQPMLIFNPRSSRDDVQVFAAVATSWDTFYPGSERGENLHNIAIEGMKNVRIIAAKNARTIDESKVSSTGVIDIALPDNQGRTRTLTELKGKVVMLDFHIFATKQSIERMMELRELYNKYHDRGFEIYQVSLDPEEHFWKENVSQVPWVCVHDPAGINSDVAAQYNVQQVPTYFLIDRGNVLQKRDAQVKDLDAEINAML